MTPTKSPTSKGQNDAAVVADLHPVRRTDAGGFYPRLMTNRDHAGEFPVPRLGGGGGLLGVLGVSGVAALGGGYQLSADRAGDPGLHRGHRAS